MKFIQLFTVSALATLAVATPTGGSGSGGSEPQCCQTVTTASDPTAAAVWGLLGIVIQDLNVLVGLTCSPITVVGSNNGACNSGTTVTCEDNSHGGLINIGCVPVTV